MLQQGARQCQSHTESDDTAAETKVSSPIGQNSLTAFGVTIEAKTKREPPNHHADVAGSSKSCSSNSLFDSNHAGSSSFFKHNKVSSKLSGNENAFELFSLVHSSINRIKIQICN